jgi:hypothetical protein
MDSQMQELAGGGLTEHKASRIPAHSSQPMQRNPPLRGLVPPDNSLPCK